MCRLHTKRLGDSRGRYAGGCPRTMASVLLLAWLAGTAWVHAADPLPETQPDGVESLPPEIVERVMRPWTGDFDGMVERRLIRVLLAYGRTSYFIDRGQQRGLTYEAFKELGDFVNQDRKGQPLKVAIAFIPVRRDQLLSCLMEGKGDIAAANLTITDARRQEVDFCDPVMTGVSEVVVTGPGSPPIARLDDLAGKEVVVRRSSSYFESLHALNASFGKAGKREIILTPANENLEDEDLLEMVNAGLLPMTVVDSHLAAFWSQVLDDIKVHDQLTVRTGGEIAWAIRKNSPRFKRVLDEFVKGHKKGTAFGNILFNRYLRGTKHARNAVSPDELVRFRKTVALFQRYAGQYGFDWQLVAAQGYQESRLDQSLRSPAGAIGVMQVLPSTAAGPPINIRGVEQLENNIHAGIAYLRHLRERYFKDEGMDPFDQQLFAFAAYNAGPARISGLRKKAKAMGLDPNKWFMNVEIVAAKEIGRETVEYVSHILQYYIAYNRLTAREAERTGPS